MEPNTLLKLMVVVAWPSPTSPYRVEHLRVDFDCGNLGATMSTICRTFKDPSDFRLARSVSGEIPFISVQSNEFSPNPIQTYSQTPSQVLVQTPSQVLVQTPSQVFVQKATRETGMLLQQQQQQQQQHSRSRPQLPTIPIIPHAAGVGVTLMTREAAHTYVKTQAGRRRRNSISTGRNLNAHDECCSHSKPKFCVFEEIAEYCIELQEGVWIP
ncbi:uncharacterized protein [Procambarus clarkii]|uniref:uncharacterized protein n=1 Tax=Procambarus clarkii TaxID=6728 RepID=UPI003744121E